MYRDSASRFGTISHVCSYEGVDSHREVISNILFVPPEEKIEKYHWNIFAKGKPTNVEIRTLRFSVFSVEGKSLVEAKNPRQLSRSWAHSLLGTFVDISDLAQLICPSVGWLSIYLSGHLHRDVSIGNVLMTDKPVKGKEFGIPEKFRDHVKSLDPEAVDAIEKLCRRVEKLVKELGISDECTGFVTDGDLAISWERYWAEDRRTVKSVSCSHIIWKAVLDAAHRVHPSSCLGH